MEFSVRMKEEVWDWGWRLDITSKVKKGNVLCLKLDVLYQSILKIYSHVLQKNYSLFNQYLP